jgi:hypothetical protein
VWLAMLCLLLLIMRSGNRGYDAFQFPRLAMVSSGGGDICLGRLEKHHHSSVSDTVLGAPGMNYLAYAELKRFTQFDAGLSQWPS